MAEPAIDIRAGERICVAGLPEMGKTNLEMALCEGQGSVVVLDCKRDPKEWAAYGRRRGYVVTGDPREIAHQALVVFEVPSLALDDREGWRKPGSTGYQWTQALMNAFERGDTLVVFAEASLALPAQGGNPHARRILREGRSRRVTSMYDLQRLVWVDTFAPALAEHQICFRQPADDLKLIRQLRGIPTPQLHELEPWHFAHHRQGWKEWVMCGPVEKILQLKSGTRRRRTADEKGAEAAPVGAKTEPAP